MPVFLYVETNFPLSYATGRSWGTDSILSDRPSSLGLIMPSVCFMKAFAVFESERKRRQQWRDSLAMQVGEVERNVISSIAPSLVKHLDQARTEGGRLFEEFKARLFQALDLLGSEAELIHPTREILASARADPLIADPTDNLILASILDHSKNHPSESKIFLSENRKDFDTNDRAKLALRQAGIRYFADASRFLDWQQAQPGS